jgi:DNA-binding response OmpR family regulator
MGPSHHAPPHAISASCLRFGIASIVRCLMKLHKDTETPGMYAKSLEEIDLIVVDDDQVSYQGFAAAVAEAGLQWIQAVDGHQALEITIAKPTKLWLANLRLPDMSGIELLNLVKAIRAGTPFYLLSDVYSVEDEKAARAAGAAGYFSKPVDTMWVDICAAALASQSVRASPQQPAHRLERHHTPTPHANVKPLS